MIAQRIDYYDSPEAPRANSLVPAVNVVVVDDAGELLLIRRTDNGNWAVPGGAVDSASPSPRRRSARPSRNPGSSAPSPASWASTPTLST
jgi:8-oxo-dGTP pyrophosphatase MutT (NUDIX family)